MIRPIARPIARAIALSTADLFRSATAGAAPAGPVTLDFTQATVPTGVVYTSAGKTYMGSDGLLHVAAANEWPLEYDTSGAVTGRSIWEPRTNLAWYSNDMTQAIWTAASATVTKDQTSIFGTANDACSVVATAANATCMQQITRSSASCNYSVYLKRLVGTGAVSITVDGGTTWTVVTLTSSYKRFNVGATVANPKFGVKLATSGDSIACSMNQLENNAACGPAIPSTGASGTSRSAEAAVYPFGDQTEGTLFVDGYVNTSNTTSSSMYYAVLNDGSNANLIGLKLATSRKMVAVVGAGGATQAQMIPGNTAGVAGARFRMAIAWAANDFASVLAGGTVITDTAGTVPTGIIQLNIGASSSGSDSSANATLRMITVYPTRMADTDIDTLTS